MIRPRLSKNIDQIGDPPISTGVWGAITGILTNQTDLVNYIANAVSAYLPLAGGTMLGNINFATAASKRLTGISQTTPSTGGLQYNNYLGLSELNSNGGITSSSTLATNVNIYSQETLSPNGYSVITNNLTGNFSFNGNNSGYYIGSHDTSYGYNTIQANPGNISLVSTNSNSTIQSSLYITNTEVKLNTISNNIFAFLRTTNLTTNKTFEFPNISGTLVTTAGTTFAGNVILNADPTLALGAATKNYVDNIVNGITWKNAVLISTTGNITLSGEQTIDGILTSGTRILVKNQTTATQNGIYISNASAWTRSLDEATAAEILGATVYVISGTVNIGTVWNNNNTSIVLGTTNITFVQIAGVGTYTASNGITQTGNTFKLGGNLIADTSIDGAFLLLLGQTVPLTQFNLTANTQISLDVSTTASDNGISINNTFVSLTAYNNISNAFSTVNASSNGVKTYWTDGGLNITQAFAQQGSFSIISNAANLYFNANLKTNLITTVDRNFEFPDASGTLALVSSIPTLPTVTTITSSTTLTYTGLLERTVLGDTSAGVFTTTLPSASGFTGYKFVLKKVGAGTNTWTINTTSAQTIDGSLTATINVTNVSITLQSIGSSWIII